MKQTSKVAGWRRQGAIDGIAHTALELFMRDGFDATSVDAIAAAANCSPRTFYRYFGTKEDVMFHDLPDVLEGLGQALDGLLAEGLDEWSAVCEAVVDRIAWFDTSDQRFPAQRLQLWLSEPALRTRYTEYMNKAEQVIAESLYRHRGTTPGRDDAPRLLAVAATGAFRVTLTHTPASQAKLAKHLRDALASFGAGLAASAPVPAPLRAAS
jgi:AcrR family transcriptional regulator